MNSRDAIKALEDGWYEVSQAGSHRAVQARHGKGPRHGAAFETGSPDRNPQEHRKTGRDQAEVIRRREIQAMDYIAYLHKDRNSDYGVSFPDFPGCITAGKTLDEAHRMAVEALALHVAGMREDGEEIKPPSTLDTLVRDPAMKNAVAFLVHLEPP